HLGNSVNEINPKFALENAPDFVNGIFSTLSSQVDNPDLAAAVPKTPVALTQLRNLLAGTRPQYNAFALTGTNNDTNYVYVNGSAIVPGTPLFMPNGLYDPGDATFAGGNPAGRPTPAVAGRWGEEDGIPTILNGAVPGGWPNPAPPSTTTRYAPAD